MRIRNRYDAGVPVVVGPVARRHPIYVDDARFLRGETARRVKYTLPGPMTMVDTLYDDHYRSREKLAWAFAEILNEEARAIAAAGVDVIQFDEPAFNVYFDEVRDWGIAALERAAQGLACKTAVHICYGYGIKANIEWKKTLGGEWRQYEQTFPLLAASSIDQVSLECANSHVPIDLIALLGGKDVLVGAIDVADRPRGNAGGGRRRTIRARCASFRPSASTPAPTAAWCRCPATWRAGSSAPSARVPRWCAPSSPDEDRPPGSSPRSPHDRPFGVSARIRLMPASTTPIRNLPKVAYSPERVLFQAVKHALYDRFAVVLPPYFP